MATRVATPDTQIDVNAPSVGGANIGASSAVAEFSAPLVNAIGRKLAQVRAGEQARIKAAQEEEADERAARVLNNMTTLSSDIVNNIGQDKAYKNPTQAKAALQAQLITELTKNKVPSDKWSRVRETVSPLINTIGSENTFEVKGMTYIQYADGHVEMRMPPEMTDEDARIEYIVANMPVGTFNMFQELNATNPGAAATFAHKWASDYAEIESLSTRVQKKELNAKLMAVNTQEKEAFIKDAKPRLLETIRGLLNNPRERYKEQLLTKTITNGELAYTSFSEEVESILSNPEVVKQLQRVQMTSSDVLTELRPYLELTKASFTQFSQQTMDKVAVEQDKLRAEAILNKALGGPAGVAEHKYLSNAMNIATTRLVMQNVLEQMGQEMPEFTPDTYEMINSNNQSTLANIGDVRNNPEAGRRAMTELLTRITAVYDRKQPVVSRVAAGDVEVLRKLYEEVSNSNYLKQNILTNPEEADKWARYEARIQRTLSMGGQ